MKSIQILMEEHRNVMKGLNVLEQISKDIESEKDGVAQNLKTILDFFKIYTDKSHHTKEEDALFPAMVESGIPRYGGPVDIMLFEHNVGRNFILEMDRVLQNFESGGGALTEINKPAKAYVELLREHIYKEDNILYPIAEIHISPEQDEMIIKKFEEIDNATGAKNHLLTLNTMNYI